MATALGTILYHLRGRVFRHDEPLIPDGALLDSFLTRRDEAAFEALLRRHGPMVLGVCQRLLSNEADAEDAFQATFLVLVRKGASIRPRGMVGNWLYGVARSTALKARAMSNKRAARERHAAAQAKTETAAPAEDRLATLLDQELALLPAHYRSAIVLCDLEGKTIKEAAQQLGCPQGTVGTQLSRGRALLARRLARHGLPCSAAAVAGLIAEHAPAASVPASLTSTTLQAALLQAAGKTVAGIVSANAVQLTEGVIKIMFLSKLKIFAACLLFVVAAAFCSSGYVWTPAVRAEGEAVAAGVPEKKAGNKKAPEKNVNAEGMKALEEILWLLASDLNFHGVHGKLEMIRKEGKFWKVHDCRACHMHPFEENPAPKDDAKERNALLKALTVRAALRDLEETVDKLRHATGDRKMQLEALEEIEKAIRELRDKVKNKR